MIFFVSLAGCMLVTCAVIFLLFRFNHRTSTREVILSDDGKPGTEIHVQMTQGALTRLYADVMTSPAMLRLLGHVAWLFILRVGATCILAALIILSGIFLYGCFDHAAFRDAGGTDWTHILSAVWRWQPDVWLLLSLIKCGGDMYKYNAPGLFCRELRRIFAGKVAAKYGLYHHPSMIAHEKPHLSR